MRALMLYNSMVRRRMWPLDDLDEPTPLRASPRYWLWLALTALAVHMIGMCPPLRNVLHAIACGVAILVAIVMAAEGADAALRRAGARPPVV